MTSLGHASWAASKALRRGDLKTYDRWFQRAVKASAALARSLSIHIQCSICGDDNVDPKYARCAACRALCRTEPMRRAA